MPIINVPGVGQVRFPEGMSDEEITRAIERDILPKVKVEKPEEGLGAAIKGGAKRLASTVQTGIESLFDPEAAAKRGLAREEEISRQYAPATSLEAVKQAYAERGLLPAAGEVVSQVPGAVAEQAPQIGATLASARLGAMAGAPFGPVGAVIGGVGGAALPSLAQLFGSNIQRQAEEGQPISRAKAAAAAVPGAALETASTFIPLGRSLVGKLLGPEAEKLLARGGSKVADEGLAKVLTKGAAVGAGFEIPTEVTQQMLERLQAGLPLTTPDALAEYGEAAYGAGLVGGPFGAVGRVGQRYVARGEREKEVGEARRLQEEIAGAERRAAEEAEAQRKTTPEFRQELNAQIVALQDELRQVDPIARDKKVDPEVRAEAQARVKELRGNLKELNEQMRASMKTAGAPTSLAGELARRAREPQPTQITDEFGNIITPKTTAPTEAEVAEGYERQAESVLERDRERQAALARLREQEEADRQKVYEQTQQGIKNYLAGLEEVEETNTQVLKQRLAEQQQRKEEDVAQDITLDRVNLVLENFGLRAAGFAPEERKAIEDKINEGVVNRFVSGALGIKGLGGRTVSAAEALPSIEERFQELSKKSREAAAKADKLMDPNGQLTPAGYRFVADQAKLRELDRLRTMARQAQETPLEQEVAGTIEGATKPEPAAVLIESGLPTVTYKNKADEANRQAAGRFTDLTALMDDYRKGRFFGEKGAKRDVELASYTREGLLKETEEARKNVVDQLINEVAYRRMEQGLRPFTRDEAIGFGIQVDEIIKELINRSTALPSGYSLERVVTETAQMRGSEIVKEAKTDLFDTRKLKDRQFGSPQRAMEVLAEMIKQAKEQAIAAGKREVRADKGTLQLLKTPREAAPTDLVQDLDRVLRMENLQPDVRDTLEQARSRMEEGGISEGLEELIDEQVGRILRGTDRPFVVPKERDVTKPGGMREFGISRRDLTARNMRAELIDEIKTQMRFDSELAQYAQGEQRTLVPRNVNQFGRGFAEVDVQPSLFPETEATARATPAQFQRLQKSAKVQKQRDIIAAEKAGAEEAEAEKRRKAKAAAVIKAETTPARQVESQMQSVRNVLSEVMEEYRGKKQAQILDKTKQLKFLMKSVRTKALKRLDQITNAASKRRYIKDVEEDLAFHFPAEAKLIKQVEAQIKKLQDEQINRIATLDQRVQNEIKFLKTLEKRAALAEKGTPEQRRAEKQAALVRGQILKAEQAIKDAKEAASDRASEREVMRKTGLGLPGVKVEAQRRELAKGKGVVRRSKITPILSRAEVEDLKAERRAQMQEMDKPLEKDEVMAALKKIERLSSGQRTTQAKLYLEAAADAKRAQLQLDNYLKKLGNKEPNKQRIVALRNEVDETSKIVRELNRRIASEISATFRGVEEPAVPVRKAPTRGPIGGEVKFYDKKFTPDQLRNMSSLGLNAFPSGKTYSVDDSIDFAIGDREGGGIDLAQAENRIRSVIAKLNAQGKKVGPDMTRRRLVQGVGAGLAVPKMPSSLVKLFETTKLTNDAVFKAVYEAENWFNSIVDTLPKSISKDYGLTTSTIYNAVEKIAGADAARMIDSFSYADPIDVYVDDFIESNNDPQILSKIKRAYDVAATDIFKYAANKLQTTETKTEPSKEFAVKVGTLQTEASAPIQFIYFPTMGDVTTDILKQMARQGVDIFTTRIRGGVKPDGTVFVIGENHTDMTDLNKTITHEFVGHYTFEGLLGPDGMRSLLKRVDKAFGDVYKLADKLGVREDADAAYVQAKNFGATDEEANLKALREVIAYTMEKRVDQPFLEKAKRWIQELVGAARDFMKKMGVNLDLSTNDLFYMMKQANEAFEAGKPIAYKKTNGDIDFSGTTPKYAPGTEDIGAIADKIIGRQKGVMDKVKANTMGLAGRVQFVDRWAALEELTNRGVEKGIIDSLKAADVMYFARMADQRHSFVAEIANNGALKIKSSRRADGQVEKLIESERGASLKDISEALANANVGDSDATGRLFTLYLAAERASRVGLNKLNYSGKLTEADLKKALDFGRSNAAFQKARDLYNEYNRGLIEFAVKTGAISPDLGEKLTKTNDYVPYYRMRGGVVDLIVGSEQPIRIGDVKNQPYLEELVGGDEAIMDFFTSSLQNTTLLTDMALRNMATYESANALKDLGVAKIKPGNGPAASNIIRFKYDGKEFHAEIDTKAKKDMFGDIPSDLVVKGMEGIKLIVPGVVRGLAGPANILRKFVTRDPRYAVRQIFRDSMAAVFTTGANMTPVVDTMGEIAKMGKSDTYQKLQRRGILGGQVITGAPEDMQKVMQQLTAGKPGWELAMAKLDQWAQTGDAATRMSMYNSFLKQGLSEREATLASLESMNFGRRGVSPSIYFLNATVPFFNAGIQGLDVLYRAYKGKMPYSEQLKIRQKLISRGLMMAAFTMTYAAMMQDDEAYKNAPPEQRYANWFIRIPGFDEPFRVPIPFDLGLIFKAIPEGVYNAAFTDEKGSKIAKDLAGQIMRTLPGSPAEAGVPIPAAIKPLIETALNKSFFTGRDVVDARLEGLEKQYQYRDKTPEVLKLIAPATAMVGLSPVQLENLIRGYTGSLGVGLLSLVNPVLKTGEAGKVEGRVSEIPLIGGLFQPNDAGRVIDEAYDSVKEIQGKQRTYKKLLEEGQVQEAQQYMKDNISDVGLASYAGAFRQQMGNITKVERAVRATPASEMSPEKKREELDKLRDLKITLAKRFSDVREQIGRQASR